METFRRDFHPVVPSSLIDLRACTFIPKRTCLIEEGIKSLFSNISSCSVLRCVSQTATDRPAPSSLHIGVLFSGGPAPGGHTVIAGLFDAIKEWHEDSLLTGFINGPKGLLRNTSQKLSRDDIDAVRHTGGFSLLGTGRSKIETQEDIQKVIATVREHALDGLVIIGGDDSNTDAAFLAEAFAAHHMQTAVVGVPKTIDGDLKSEDIPISFGFDTACKVYSEIVGNLARDALSSKKYYYFIRLMGRAASHITLECALQTHPNLALMSEEVAARSLTLQNLADEITSLVVERAELHKNFGVILIPEGLVEHLVDVKGLISELNELFAPLHPVAPSLKELRTTSERLDFVLEHLSSESKACLKLFPRHIAEELLLERDPHGNVQVSRIETERLLAGLVEAEIRTTPISFAYQTMFLGYEGRSAFPSVFDCTYCYSLGRLSALLVAHKHSGFMAALSRLHEKPQEWEPLAVPLISLLHFERRKGEKKPVIRRVLVDLQGKPFTLFAKERDSWRLLDHYSQPGPMQFWGPDELVLSPCITIP